MAAVPPGYNPAASLLPDPGSSAAPIHTMMGGGGYTEEQKEQIIKDLDVSADDKDEFIKQLVDLNCSMDKQVILDSRCNVVQKYLGKSIRSKINSSVNSTEIVELSEEEAKFFKGNSEGKVLTFQYEVGKKKLFADYKVGTVYYRIYGKTPDAIIAKFEAEIRNKIEQPAAETKVEEPKKEEVKVEEEVKKEETNHEDDKIDLIKKEEVPKEDLKVEEVKEEKKPEKRIGQLRVEAVLAARKKLEEEKRKAEEEKRKADEEKQKSKKSDKTPGQLRVEEVLAAKKKANEGKTVKNTSDTKTEGGKRKTRRAIKE